MKKKNNHIDLTKHLTQEELLDYSNGILGNDELYRLELHLNECEFCSDAMEGIEIFNSPKNTLISLSNDINPQKNSQKGFQYLAMAASVALIAVVGLSYWLMNNDVEEANIALNTPVENVIENSKVIDEDEITTNKEDEELSSINNEDSLIESNTKLPIRSEPTFNQVADNDNKQKITFKQEPEQPAAADLPNESLAEATEEKEDEPVSGMADSERTSTTSQPSNNQVSRSAKKAITEPIPVLKDQKTPSPQGGMDALKKYIEQNLAYPQQAIDNKTKGTVVLEVTVSVDGALKNIAITKSIGSGCDVEAKRLITSGPKWLPAVKNGITMESKRQVKIKFKY